MLVVNRRANESVVIGDPLSPLGRVTVTEIDRKRNRVVLGFEFPKETTVHRGEVAERLVASGGTRATPKERPPVRISDGPCGLIREIRLQDRFVAAVGFFAGVGMPIAGANLWNAVSERKLCRSAIERLVEWGLLEVMADKAVRLSRLGERAALEYRRAGRITG